MIASNAILAQQIRWAGSRGLTVDARGYVDSVRANLFTPLSPAAAVSLGKGSGGELLEGASHPAKMRALHSSAALAVNVFDFWSNRDRTALERALEIDSRICSLEFEAQFPMRLRGTPPNLDVAFRLANRHLIAIESKFTEWLSAKPKDGAKFAPSYFPEDGALWTAAGLASCQEVAEAVQRGPASYRLLDVPQLLKHMLGIATQHPGRWQLLYLYYDSPTMTGEQHRHELARFANSLGTTVPFQSLSYQELIQRLSDYCSADTFDYVQWLLTRYGNGLLSNERCT